MHAWWWFSAQRWELGPWWRGRGWRTTILSSTLGTPSLTSTSMPGGPAPLCKSGLRLLARGRGNTLRVNNTRYGTRHTRHDTHEAPMKCEARPRVSRQTAHTAGGRRKASAHWCGGHLALALSCCSSLEKKPLRKLNMLLCSSCGCSSCSTATYARSKGRRVAKGRVSARKEKPLLPFAARSGDYTQRGGIPAALRPDPCREDFGFGRCHGSREEGRWARDARRQLLLDAHRRKVLAAFEQCASVEFRNLGWEKEKEKTTAP